MPHVGSTIVVAVSAYLLACWVYRNEARAQEGAPDAADPAGRAGAEYPDIYIDDSFEALEALQTAERLAGRRQWDEAARTLDRVIVEFGDKLYRLAPGRYAPVARRAREMIASWPADGLTAYRQRFETQARQALEGSAGSLNPAELYDLLDRYYCTAVGVEIADRLGELLIEAGAFAQARAVYEQLLLDHPDVRSDPSAIAARLAVACALAGDAEAARQWTRQARKASPDPTLRWQGQLRPVADLVEEWIKSPPQPQTASGRFEWKTFGGENERNRQGELSVDEAASLWRLEGAGAAVDPLAAPDDRSSGYERALEGGRFLSMNPIVSGGMLYVHDSFTATAIGLDRGAPAWRYTPFGEGTRSSSASSGGAVRWHVGTYEGGRLYLVFGGEDGGAFGGEDGEGGSLLVCLDAVSGLEMWRTHQAGFDEAFSRSVFDPVPLVCGGQVCVVVRRRRTFGFEDCYLCRYDVDTGALLGRTHLGGASTGGFGFRRATLAIPAASDGVVFIATNLGTIAAVNAYSGRLHWLSLYPRLAGVQWGGSGPGATAPWHYNPVLVAGDRVVCYPLDSPAVVIVDAATGAITASLGVSSLADAAYLVGVRDQVLYGVGQGVFACELESQQLLWSSPLPADDPLYGRGVLTSTEVLVPTRGGIRRYSIAGEAAGMIRWESPEDAGNILAMGDRCLVVGNDRVTAYARKDDVWARLRRRMADAPSDPEPALDMAEVALRGGDIHEALAALEAAVERAGGLAVMIEGDLKRRVFNDCLALSDQAQAGAPPDVQTAIRVLALAAQCAPDVDAEVSYRVRLAKLHEQAGDYPAAVETYQQLITDRSLRSAPVHSDQRGEATAGALARARIDGLIEAQGGEIYSKFEARAGEWLEAGTRSGDAAFLERLVDTYPNAQAAPLALIEVGRLLRQTGKPIQAVKHLLAAYRQYGRRAEMPQVLMLIADCYVDAGRPELAWRWLTKAMRQYPNLRLTFGRMPEEGGFAEYRARLALDAERQGLGDLRSGVEPSRPAMRLPLDSSTVRRFDAACHLLEPLYGEHPRSAWDAYYVYSDAHIQLFDAAGDRARWEAAAPCRMRPELLLATEGQAVFVTRHQVFAVDPSNGRRIWEYGKYPADLADALTDHEMFATFRVYGVGRDRMVVFQDTGQTACIELNTGEVVWDHLLDLRARGPVVVSDLWVAYAASSEGRDVTCIVDLDSGEVMHVIDPRDDQRVERMLDCLEQLVVVTTQSLRVYDPYSGEPFWEADRRRHVLARTVQVDLDGIYLSDDGRHLLKFDLESGRLIWQSDRLPVRAPDSLSVLLDGEQLIVSTEKSVHALDTFDGRLLWEGTIPQDAHLGTRVLTDSYVVAVDAVVPEAEAPYRAYFLDHRAAEGRLASEGGMLELGSFENVKAIAVRDNAILLATDRAIHGWSRE